MPSRCKDIAILRCSSTRSLAILASMAGCAMSRNLHRCESVPFLEGELEKRHHHVMVALGKSNSLAKVCAAQDREAVHSKRRDVNSFSGVIAEMRIARERCGVIANPDHLIHRNACFMRAQRGRADVSAFQGLGCGNPFLRKRVHDRGELADGIDFVVETDQQGSLCKRRGPAYPVCLSKT